MAWFIKVTNQSFRPLPGTYISQSYLLSEHIIPFRFPSPTGDLYFSIMRKSAKKSLQRFPSPTGDLYVSIINDEYDRLEFLFPSPTGDLYFSIGNQFLPGNCIYVSVPYRGLIFLNNSLVSEEGEMLFPSPTGDLYFSISC